jgi:hypothetical protein
MSRYNNVEILNNREKEKSLETPENKKNRKTI